MKFIYQAIAASFFLSSVAQANQPVPINLDVEEVFSIENGFDTNDQIEIAVRGSLPDSCHKLGKGFVRIDHTNKKLFVRVEGYVRNSDICLQMTTPFLEVIRVGHLAAGRYQVVAENQPEIFGMMNVKPFNNEDQDDFLYAPVDNASLSLINTFASGYQHLTLEGTYPFLLKGCMRITEIKTYLTSGNILIVQPVSEIFEEAYCQDGGADTYNRYKLVKKIDSPILEKGLVHVRTLNGKSLNQLVDFTELK